MKLNITFDITLHCDHFKKCSNQEFEKLSSVYNIDLNLTKEEAYNFIFRNGTNNFKVGEYTVNIHQEDTIGIALIRDNNVYIVTNVKEVINDIIEGYIRIRTTEKLSSIMEFDFETCYKEDDSGIIDEFDLN